MMDNSSLQFITCPELIEEFKKCPDDINKRILIIDIRNPTLYERSHLCLAVRSNISSIKTKMRVMNIDPDLMKTCTPKNIMSILNESDLGVFKKRRDATDIVIIDSNTDDPCDMVEPRSKVMRLIKGLTIYDTQKEDKINVPIKILRGGYRSWIMQYPHWTTDPTFNPDTKVDDPTTQLTSENHIVIKPQATILPPTPIYSSPKCPGESDISVSPPDISVPVISPKRPVPSPPTTQVLQPQTPPKPPISKPVPIPPARIATAPRPVIVKNAPGTAIPVTPMSSLRTPLPRSHSSPNVAQSDGDEMGDIIQQFDSHSISNKNPTTIVSYNNNNIIPSAPKIVPKPRFDRTLKPAFNIESINALRAQLNFGRSPEASGRAITGLQNLGNTCFLNSVIQCLAYAPTLSSYFCSDLYYNHINFSSQYGTKGEMAVEFGALVEKLNAHKHRYIEPKSFRESVVTHIGFAGNEQQDSHEFMMMLFDKLHHDLNVHAREKSNGLQNGNNKDDSNINTPRATLGYQFWKRHLEMNKSIISDSFEGIFMSTLTCTFCKGQSNTFEVFNCLSLPIPSDSRCHIRDCLSHFSNPERIEAAWECPRCKVKREADKKIVICKLPQILVIHLKRFSLDGRWRQKLQTTVDFPLTDLSVDCTNVLPQSAYTTPSKSSYNLYGVVNHYGHLDGGHYTAFCKLDNQRWYTFDDSNVTEMKELDVCGQAAYILFYTR